MSVAAPAPARTGRRAPEPTPPDTQPRRAEGARRPNGGTRALSPTVAGLLVVCALLLVGIVAVQVAALQQNIAQGKVDDERGQLQAANQNLQAQIDRRSSPNAIAERASTLGMVPAPSDVVQILPGG